MVPEPNEQHTSPIPGAPGRVRGVTAAALLVLGLLLPWNLQVGFRIAGTPAWAIALVVTVTVLASCALAVTWGDRAAGAPAALRWLLVVPYLVLVAAFTVWTVVVSIRAGGDGTVPPGIGPGAWSGLAGALLAAQPRIPDETDQQRHDRACRVIGWLSMTLAVAAALLSLYLRTRYVIPGIGGEATMANLTTAIAAVLYSAVALAPVIVVGRWIITGSGASRLAVVLLAASTVVAGAVVWVLPVGRLLDGFHGIAQRTGTSFVGYEGYLAWTAVAAIIGTGTLAAARFLRSLWRNAIRSCLMLIAIWCAGQAVLRITDVVLAGVLTLPTPPYSSTTLMAFDLIAAVLAAWLWVNSGARTLPETATVLLFGGLFVLSVCRLVLGIALVPTVEPLTGGGLDAVYGNHLSQQITSTFDVTIAVLSLLLLVAYLRDSRRPATGTGATVARPVPSVAGPAPVIAAPAPAIASPASVEGRPAATTAAVGDSAPGGVTQADRIAEVLAQSSQRFGAGTTYGAAKSTPTEEP